MFSYLSSNEFRDSLYVREMVQILQAECSVQTIRLALKKRLVKLRTFVKFGRLSRTTRYRLPFAIGFGYVPDLLLIPATDAA